MRLVYLALGSRFGLLTRLERPMLLVTVKNCSPTPSPARAAILSYPICMFDCHSGAQG